MSGELSHQSDDAVDDTIEDGIERLSIGAESYREACAEKWIRSMQAGYDVGECAIRQWVLDHWRGFVRARWIEHMLGVRFWIELDRNEFGLLKRLPITLKPVLDQIVDQLYRGAENLNIIVWSRTRPAEERPAIHELLGIININAHRLRCHFSDS